MTAKLSSYDVVIMSDWKVPDLATGNINNDYVRAIGKLVSTFD